MKTYWFGIIVELVEADGFKETMGTIHIYDLKNTVS